MQEGNLTAELREFFHRTMRQHERGLCSSEETTGMLLGGIRDHVDRFYGDHDRRSRKREADALAINVAKSELVTKDFLAHGCWLCPPGNDAVLDARIEAVISHVRSVSDIQDPGTFDLLDAWLTGGGGISEDLARSLRHGEGLSNASWLRYLHSCNMGDMRSVWCVIDADVEAGCPASLLVHLDRSNATEADVASALGRIDRARMQREERWGDLASVAVFLAERGWLEWSSTWSNMILNEGILPLMTFADQTHHEALGVRLACAISNDARVLGPLALIDFLAGKHANADRRIERSYELDRDVGHLHHAFVGHKALIDWVRSRRVSRADLRREILEGIEPHDAWLGLLQAQIEADLAALAEEMGDSATASRSHERASRIRADRPEVELYVAPFPYNKLLGQLPVAQ